jgi:hypothetical protein
MLAGGVFGNDANLHPQDGNRLSSSGRLSPRIGWEKRGSRKEDP